MNVQSIKRARSLYAVSCITSPGGKHRFLAGSVAVLITESLLMLNSLYIVSVARGIDTDDQQVLLEATIAFWANGELHFIQLLFGPLFT
jgi:hypothetical protein